MPCFLKSAFFFRFANSRYKQKYTWAQLPWIQIGVKQSSLTLLMDIVTMKLPPNALIFLTALGVEFHVNFLNRCRVNALSGEQASKAGIFLFSEIQQLLKLLLRCVVFGCRNEIRQKNENTLRSCFDVIVLLCPVSLLAQFCKPPGVKIPIFKRVKGHGREIGIDFFSLFLSQKTMMFRLSK